MRTGHGHQGRYREVVAQTMRTLYKQLVEYCCGSLSSSLVNTQLVFSTRYPNCEIYCLCFHWTLVQWLPQQLVDNILFIQKPLWNFVCFVLLTTIYGGDEVIGAPIHPQRSEQMSRVIYFIHFRLSRSCFSLRRNIVNHRDIQLLFFFNKKDVNSS